MIKDTQLCGICGSCSNNKGNRLSEVSIQAMADTMFHRGPDGSGYYVDDFASLGHRRLSIIDLEGGGQPIYNEDRSIAVVFNGEIYNFKELQTQLLQRGHKLATNSDTEVLVHLYEDLGVNLVNELNGMFSFAIWDAKNRKLFAARDRMGEKPFYYHVDPAGDIRFASEIKAIIRSLDQRPNISVDAMRDYLMYGYIAAPRTAYEAIRKLPPAHYLIWAEGSVVTERYWSPSTCANITVSNEHDCLEQLETLLEDSIRLRLRSDVPIGAFLSGGVDSSIIVGLASRITEKPLQTFVIGFEEHVFDESQYAKQVSDVFGTEHHEIIVSDPSLDILPELVAQFDEPFADPSSLPTYYVTQAASRALKVCLSGDGADEVFAGYRRYLQGSVERLVDRFPPFLSRRALAALSHRLPNSFPGAGQLSLLSAVGAERYQQMTGIFSPAEIIELFRPEYAKHERSANIFAQFFAEHPTNSVEPRIRADIETYLPDDILAKVDRTSMLNSLEVRTPFLDHRLVEFANVIPFDLKIHGKNCKYLLKKLLATMLPSDFVNRRKHGFSLPIREWFRKDYASNLKEIILRDDAHLYEYLRRPAIESYFRTHQSGLRDRSPQLWALLWLELWLIQQNS